MSWRPLAVGVLMSFWVLPASAQVRGGGNQFSGGASHFASSGQIGTMRSSPPAPRAVVAAHPVANYPTRSRRATGTTPVSTVNSALAAAGYGCCGGTIQDLFGFPVPGLGFDYANYGALNSTLGVRALIDPVTQQEIALALRLRGFGVGTGYYPGYYLPYGGAPIVMETPSVAAAPATDTAPQQQQPIIVVTPPAPAQAAAEQTPLQDPGEFVLVERDGRLLFAVAFTSADGRVVYVTKDGMRRSIPLSQIDVDATLRMNEERGTSVQLPAA